MVAKLLNRKRKETKVGGKDKARDTSLKRDQIVKDRLKKIMKSKKAHSTVHELHEVVCKLDPEKLSANLNYLIDFTIRLHQFRKHSKKDLEFIKTHINGLSKGPVGEFIRILDGEYGDIKVYFDTENFNRDAFENGLTITNGSKKTIAELRKSPDPEMISTICGYMRRATGLMDLMRHY
ncbi:hypothetical protein KKG31_07250 [Patescibacteria group bacterium]|nr:hypothetical protein [Patescibacteria group bacterium]